MAPATDGQLCHATCWWLANAIEVLSDSADRVDHRLGAFPVREVAHIFEGVGGHQLGEAIEPGSTPR